LSESSHGADAEVPLAPREEERFAALLGEVQSLHGKFDWVMRGLVIATVVAALVEAPVLAWGFGALFTVFVLGEFMRIDRRIDALGELGAARRGRRPDRRDDPEAVAKRPPRA